MLSPSIAPETMETRLQTGLSAEEERDHFRQRYESMKLVMKELQQQMMVLKTRCSGVETMTLMLKESKEQISALTRQKQALETAVANLQNRLSTNGLSNSVNIEESELFVPGASKQTLDNLAKENARLKTLIKNNDNLPSKKSSEELQALKTTMDGLEAENNQLKTKLFELESLKLQLVEQYEKQLKDIREESQAEVKTLSKLIKKDSSKDFRQGDSEVPLEFASVETQTEQGPGFEKISEIKRRFQAMKESILQIDEDFKSLLSPSSIPDWARNEPASTIPETAFRELERKFNEAMMMNRRWQNHNEEQEKELNALRSRSAALEELCRESESWKHQAEVKALEVDDLKQNLALLLQERNKRGSQVDPSIIEILKQQIQVCTEDFNTERKDREEAVNKAKHLQAEVLRLGHENETLKAKLGLAPIFPAGGPPGLRQPSSMTQPPMESVPRYPPRFTNPSYPSLPAPNMSLPPSVVNSPAQGLEDRLPYENYLRMSFASPQPRESYRLEGSHSYPKVGSAERRTSSPSSMPPAPRSDGSPVSRAGSERSSKSYGGMACPRCGMSFPSDQNNQFLQHMSSCKE